MIGRALLNEYILDDNIANEDNDSIYKWHFVRILHALYYMFYTYDSLEWLFSTHVIGRQTYTHYVSKVDALLYMIIHLTCYSKEA